MASPTYNGPVINPLTRQEGVELTVALGSALEGDDYDNADVYGYIIHHGGRGDLQRRYEQNPEQFTQKHDAQIDKLKTIIAPYIGRWAAAKHSEIGVRNNHDWELWKRDYVDSSKVLHTSGIIMGIAGVALERTMVFDWHKGNTLDSARTSFEGKQYKIGLLLDTTFASPAFSYDVEAPNTDLMLVPLRGFPRHRETYNGLWSNLVSGVAR